MFKTVFHTFVLSDQYQVLDIKPVSSIGYGVLHWHQYWVLEWYQH